MRCAFFKWSGCGLLALATAAAAQINPGTQIRWDTSSCFLSGNMVYSPYLNKCIANGTAANPAGLTGQPQYNEGGVFGAYSSVPIAFGGSGATTAAGAMANLGYPPFIVTQFPGSDLGAQLNACFAAAAVAGTSGICDARGVVGTQTITTPVVMSSQSAGTSGIAVTLLLPPQGSWIFNTTGGSGVCGFQQNDGTAIISEGSTGEQQKFRFEAGSSFNGDSILCTDLVNDVYVRDEGFEIYNNLDTTWNSIQNGLFHIHSTFDGAIFRNIQVSGSLGDLWHIDTSCCGTIYDSDQGYGSQNAAGGIGLKIGEGYVLFDATTSTTSKTVCSAIGGSLTSTYSGQTVTGTGIPSSTTVTGVTSNECMTISNFPTANNTGLEISILAPSTHYVSETTFFNWVLNRSGIGSPEFEFTPIASGGNVDQNDNIWNFYTEGNGQYDSVAPTGYIAPTVAYLDINQYAIGGPDNTTAKNIESHANQLVTVKNIAGNVFNDVTNSAPSVGAAKGPYSSTGWQAPYWSLAGPTAIQTFGDGTVLDPPVGGGTVNYGPCATSAICTLSYGSFNLAPDTGYAFPPGYYWALPSGFFFSSAAGYQNDGAIVYTGTGSPSGSLHSYNVTPIPVAANTAYSVSARINATNVTSSTFTGIYVCANYTCGTIIATFYILAGSSGLIGGTFNTGSNTSIYLAFELSATVTSGQPVTFSEPQLNPGTSPFPYNLNTGGSPAIAGAPFVPSCSTVTDSSAVTVNTLSGPDTCGVWTLAHGTATRTLSVSNMVSGATAELHYFQDTTGGAALTGGSCNGSTTSWALGSSLGYPIQSGGFTMPIQTGASAGGWITIKYDGTYCSVVVN
jgi:hypothetical protein